MTTEYANPDFMMQTAEPMSRDDRAEWVRKGFEDLHKKGARDMQVSIHPVIPNLVLIEAWKIPIVSGKYPAPYFQLTAIEDK